MRFILCTLLAFVASVIIARAQPVAPASVNAGGSSAYTPANKYAIRYSIGQAVAGIKSPAPHNNIFQGFEQEYTDTTFHTDAQLAGFWIDSIPNQHVWSGSRLQFYVKSTFTGSGVGYAIKVLDSVKGKLTFIPRYRYFSYTADTSAQKSFRIAFITMQGSKADTQVVPFTVDPKVVPENAAFGLPNTQTPPDPASNDYLIVSTMYNKNSTYFNGFTQTLKTVEITGMNVVFEKNNANALYTYSGQQNIQEMDIYAEQVIIRDPLFLPGAKVKIYAKRLVFEDKAANSFINTCPSKYVSAYNTNGKDGQDAGEIDLYIKEFVSRSVVRFLQVGGYGQDAPTNQAGNGGKGGIFYSTLPLSDFDIHVGGAAGKGAAAASTGRGPDGPYTDNPDKLSYLHPNYLRLVMKYCNDAYYLAFKDTVLNRLVPYVSEIDKAEAGPYWNTTSDTLKLELQQISSEMSHTISQIGQHLDFFGNPPGWVPLLSFEANKTAYENEVQQAINVLYLNYWIRNSADSVQNKIDAFTAAKTQLQTAISNAVTEYNESVAKVPILQQEAEANTVKLNGLKDELQAEINSLRARAQQAVNDKHPAWLSAVSTIGQIASLLPIPVVQEVGIGITAGVAVYNDIESKNYTGAFGAIQDAITKIKDPKVEADIEKYDKDISGIPGQVSNLFGGSFSDAKKAGQILMGDIKELNTTYQNIDKILSQNQVSDQEVAKELAQMEANDPNLAKIKNEIAEVQAEEVKIIQAWNAAIQAIQKDGILIAQDVLSLNALTKNAAALDRILDNRTLLYLDKMNEDAAYTLRKYHYTMAKSYEYRTLKPYPGNLNLEPLFNSMKNIAQAGKGYALTQSDFNALKTIYDQEIQTIASVIFDEYNSNSPALSVPVRFTLSKEQMASLNAGVVTKVNPVDLGIFAPDEEDIRIINLKVVGLKASAKNGSLGTTSYMDLYLEYPNFSRIKKDGQVYLFNNYNLKTTDPICWGARYDLLSHDIDAIVPSPATNSLLESLLGLANIPQTDANILLYSQPSAWADISISRNLVNIGGTAADVNIDSLRLELTYEFVKKPVTNSDLQVVFNEPWMKPLLTVSAGDRWGRQHGYGSIYRSYSKSLDSVKVTAPAVYGQYGFVKWTDRFGNDIAGGKNTTYAFANYTDVAVMANYRLLSPVLHAPDTVYVLRSDPKGQFAVSNTNSISTSMLWKLTFWDPQLTITKADTGTNNGGNVAFSVAGDTSHKYYRIAIVAPYADNAVDTVYVKEVDRLPAGIDQSYQNVSGQLKVFPNPADMILDVQMSAAARTALEVYDLQGRLVKAYPDTEYQDATLDVSDLKPGIYLLQSRNNQGTSRVKFSIAR